ncbi:MAG TPA: serine hydrolase domain-containing protein [Planctomycetota bacterium]|jgi:CubicO group peptidase (beta-lactamase class C family)|nr:serine hydrolase domain-containing protein [Planctomycetota bacterium]
MNPVRFALLWAIVPVPAPAGASTQERPPAFATAWEELARAFRAGVEERGIVGASLLVLHRGEVVGEACHGHQDADRKRPVGEETAFHWASITKTFTAVAVMRLRDQGSLSLDDPAVRHVPELREVHSPFGSVERITLRHLMSHSAGFRDRTWPWGGDQPWHPFEPTRWDQIVAMMPYTDVRFEPGTRYAYSNPGLVFLGRTVEARTGEDYETHVEKNLLRPLGMRRAYFDKAPWHLLPNRSHSFERGASGLRELPFDFDTGITVSNGGLNAPLRDLALWLDFLLGNPERSGLHEGLLRRASLEEMFRPVVPLDPARRDGDAMGLSFFLEKRRGYDLVAHSGGQNGFVSHFYLHLPSRAALLLAFNTNVLAEAGGEEATTSALDRRLLDLFLASVLPALAR